jgi:Outer membrane efflux protein
MRIHSVLLVLLSPVCLSACVSFDIDAALSRSKEPVRLTRSSEQSQEMKGQADRLLQNASKQGLTMADAVSVMLLNSPHLQELLAMSWKEGAQAAQSSRLGNPLFTFERLRHGSDLEFGRLLSIGLLDLLMLPQRLKTAKSAMNAVELRLAGAVLDRLTQVRSAWIRAVAAQQNLLYAKQVVEAADAAATLAQRMQAVGNFNRLERARHHSFYALAAAQLVQAEQVAVQTREQLIRALGLNGEQLALLRLPDRLPELPALAMSEQEVQQAAKQQRFDVQLAHSELEVATGGRSANAIPTWLDAELGLRRDTSARGWELALRLPLLDLGDSKRDAFNAQELAALHRLQAVLVDAASSLREDYAAYRSAYLLAKHYRDEVIPLRKIVADENVLRYNGMLIGVFELLADARDQVKVVMAAQQAQEQFWLADAQLKASLLGRPALGSRTNSPMQLEAASAAQGH